MAIDLLRGVRVLDFTLAAVGPFSTRVLADLGADVIHVEWPRVRWTAQGAAAGADRRFTREKIEATTPLAEAQLFLHTNGGKKSLAVNLKTPEGVQIIKDLLPMVDVVVENMTPRVMTSFGLSYAEMAEINPRIVMCSLTGFGQQGLDGDTARACTDPVAQAMSGITWLTGERAGPPYAVGGGIGDTVTSIVGATAVLAALLGCRDTGVGQHIDLSMAESLAYLDCTALPVVAMSNGKKVPFRNGQQNSYTFPMGPFAVTGGYLSLQAPGSGPDSPWGRLCGLMSRPDLITDERFADDAHRLERTDEVIEAVEGWLCSLDSRETALTLLAAERISSGPVLSQLEMLEHPFFEQRGTFGTVEYPGIGPVRVVEPPFKFSNADAYVRGPAPEMGEHTREILSTLLGLEQDEIDRLMEGAVVHESLGARERNASSSVTDS